MKLVLIPILAVFSFSSCSSLESTVAKVKETTADSFRSVSEGTLGTAKPKIRLTKADPSRFLPEGTSITKVRAKAPASKKKGSGKVLLAKNTPPKSSDQTKPASEPEKEELGAIPPLELPPLPASNENDNGEFMGILPSLDGSDTATFIEVDGETPELPPMPEPQPEKKVSEKESA